MKEVILVAMRIFDPRPPADFETGELKVGVTIGIGLRP